MHRIIKICSRRRTRKAEFYKLLLSGDQLTAARIRGTQALHATQDQNVDRLDMWRFQCVHHHVKGLIPVAEDWERTWVRKEGQVKSLQPKEKRRLLLSRCM